MRRFAVLLLAQAIANSQTAKDIADQVIRTYAHCETYEDSGDAATTFYFNGVRTDVKPFTTAFVRGQCSRFRFEYSQVIREHRTRYIIAMEKNQISRWWSIQPPIAHPLTIDDALGAAAGVSGLTSRMIPTLLLPDLMSSRTLEGWLDLRLGKPGLVDGIPVVPLIGTFSHGTSEYWFWVGETDHLIRKVEWTQVMSANYRTEHVITYSPRINRPVDEQKLVFDPR